MVLAQPRRQKNVPKTPMFLGKGRQGYVHDLSKEEVFWCAQCHHKGLGQGRDAAVEAEVTDRAWKLPQCCLWREGCAMSRGLQKASRSWKR